MSNPIFYVKWKDDAPTWAKWTFYAAMGVAYGLLGWALILLVNKVA